MIILLVIEKVSTIQCMVYSLVHIIMGCHWSVLFINLSVGGGLQTTVVYVEEIYVMYKAIICMQSIDGLNVFVCTIIFTV